MAQTIQDKINKLRGQGNQVDSAGVLAEILEQVAEPVIFVTYDMLKKMRDEGALTAGVNYRITDYECTTTQENTQSAGHVFDIIVQAIDAHTLSEIAKAAKHENDAYFDGCKLEAWQLWYSIDNDTKRFIWADEENGKGVIYRMIDEWNNDCPYDFKNIQFVRQLAEDGSFDEDGNDVYLFTFNWYDENGECKDTSIFGNNGSLLNDEQVVSGVYGNVIKPYFYNYEQEEEEKSACKKLNSIVFHSWYEFEGNLYYGCNSNTFGNECNSNTFGNSCNSNTFGNYCNSNTFGNYCYSNTFGNECNSNTFGNSCNSNTFGNSCNSNTFGNECNSNTFGNTSQNNELQGYLKKCTIHDGVQNILIPSGTNSQQKQFCVVYNGTHGASQSNKLTINFQGGKQYPQFAALTDEGTLDIWSR